MKKQLLLLAVMLFAVAWPCFAQAQKTIYAEVKADGTNYTLSFKVSEDASFEPKANSDGTGTYNLPTAENKLTYNDKNSSATRRIANRITKADLSGLKGALPTSTAFWFYGLNGLKEIDNWDCLNTSNVTDMGSMFMNCSGMTSLDLSHFNTSNVRNMSYMFFNLDLTSLDLTAFDTRKVTNMENMFRECDKLTEIKTGENFNTGSVTTMKQMFYNCKALQNFGFVEKFDIKNVTTMEEMLLGCTGLTKLDLSKFDTQKVKSMKGMFSGCSKLSNLTLGDKFNTRNTENMSSMFLGCSSLTDPDAIVGKLETQAATDMSSMLSGCGFQTLDFTKYPNFKTDNVTSMSSMFSGCSKLTSLNLSTFNTTNVTTMDYMFSGCSSLPRIDITGFNKFPSSTKNVTTMKGMFNGCTALPSIDLSNLNTESVKDMSYMFQNCSNKDLTTIDVSHFNTGNVTTMAYMFGNCNKVQTINVGRINTAKVQIMASMFRDCNSLKVLDVSYFNTGEVTTMNSMFYNCYNLAPINLKSFNTAKVTSMGSMFFGCSSLTEFAPDPQKFNTSNVTTMNSMFANCSNLRDIDVSYFKTNKVTNMASMFNRCTKLVKLDISNWNLDGIKNDDRNIQNFAAYCSNLQEVNVGKNTVGPLSSEGTAFFRVGTAAKPCHLTSTFDISYLGDAQMTRVNSRAPYRIFKQGYFTIAEEMNCSKEEKECPDEEYKPEPKNYNIDLWQSHRAFNVNQYNTLVVPVALTFNSDKDNQGQLQKAFGPGVKVYRLESYSGKTIYFRSVQDGDIIKANEPVLVMPVENVENPGYVGVKIETPTNNLTVRSQPSADKKTASFIGSYKRYKQLTSTDDFYFSTSRGFFVRSDGNAHIGNTRAYFRLSDHPITPLTLKIDDNGISTNIDSIDGEAVGQPEGPAYNLSGQRVGNDYKGIVIVNGKKVLRK